VILGVVHSIADESAGLDMDILTADCRQPHGRRQFRYALKLAAEHEVAEDERNSNPSTVENSERCIKIGIRSSFGGDDLDRTFCSGGLNFFSLILVGRIRWIDEDADDGNRGKQLARDFDVFSRQAFNLTQNARHIAALSGRRHRAHHTGRPCTLRRGKPCVLVHAPFRRV
jgi:hypothetical protein